MAQKGTWLRGPAPGINDMETAMLVARSGGQGPPEGMGGEVRSWLMTVRMIRRSGCQSYSLSVCFTAARLGDPGATAHHRQRGGRRWQVNDRARVAAVHAVRRPDRRRGYRAD